MGTNSTPFRRLAWLSFHKFQPRIASFHRLFGALLGRLPVTSIPVGCRVRYVYSHVLITWPYLRNLCARG
ncbi:hypothetical protein Y032_0129g1497 [Ancylostoma ceylanicum]|uniref:Uncharacterized protein n=1 Tax=Ancylostoma ceylanicum TaxID=53326 RepID=A0A016T7G6_9BILA|nr:hypothetical protein Y032_0129g1497 [Ancylostoma ceylanicum]